MADAPPRKTRNLTHKDELIRSFEEVADLKYAVDAALAHKAQLLEHAHGQPPNLHRLAA